MLSFKFYNLGGFWLVCFLRSLRVYFLQVRFLRYRAGTKPTKNRLFGVPLSLQPLPSLCSVQWLPSAPLLSLPRVKNRKLEIKANIFKLYKKKSPL